MESCKPACKKNTFGVSIDTPKVIFNTPRVISDTPRVISVSRDNWLSHNRFAPVDDIDTLLESVGGVSQTQSAQAVDATLHGG